jgi:hypothetical protein
VPHQLGHSRVDAPAGQALSMTLLLPLALLLASTFHLFLGEAGALGALPKSRPRLRSQLAIEAGCRESRSSTGGFPGLAGPGLRPDTFLPAMLHKYIAA